MNTPSFVIIALALQQCYDVHHDYGSKDPTNNPKFKNSARFINYIPPHQLLVEVMMRSRWHCGFRLMIGVKSQVISRLIEDIRGVTAIEYALIAALIAVAAIAAFTAVGTDLSTTFSYVASQL